MCHQSTILSEQQIFISNENTCLRFISKVNYQLEYINAEYNTVITPYCFKFIKSHWKVWKSGINLMLKFKAIDIPRELWKGYKIAVKCHALLSTVLVTMALNYSFNEN